ncbi:MAG: threonine synthase [Chloroflexota bacterium]|nr:threonine synthase [Chloroflexota bacterium]MDE2942229.1 threonine synthase [Chloroflexota bacterium]MDE3267696.1 threonine synthase [Chloroflexota bacterium]
MRQGVLERYRELLEITPNTPMISMGEGSTPLVRSRFIENEVGCAELYFKLEGCNPSGSFKDRGMVMAVAKAIEDGSAAIMCASTGNTSASAAAYGAYCGLTTIVLVPSGDVAAGKMAQALAYHPRILVVNGTFDQALEMVRTFTQRYPVTLVNSLNPHRLEGQKTAAFEIVDDLGDAPDFLFIPVGNAGNITAYWRGFSQYADLGRAETLPRMMGYQAEGAAPIVRGEPIAEPSTVASAIRIGNPASWQQALTARDQSGGVIDSVTDDEILSAYRMLSRREGIFAEPASAASVAGVIKFSGQLDLAGKRVVCVITGSGLKDPDLATQNIDMSLQELPPELWAMEKVLEEVVQGTLSLGPKA